ncbi:MUTS homolog 2 [Actinidia rufa]|uniref:DNA mismatch repair protein MSH2 n=1 Tax=Actinidia rufa TaxID=165716 RepID=A0A7J0G547_9ERIC|nr:MUTS homolog 2 [Actinidia rufa]
MQLSLQRHITILLLLTTTGFETIACDLLLERTDHTLELYEGSGSNWRLVKSGSPGNLGSFEDILFANNEMQDFPRVLGLVEFLDDSHFTNVESALVALGCKECLLPTDSAKSSECRPLHDALSRCGVMLTERKKTEFKGRDLVQDLGRLVKGSIEPVRDLVSGFEFATGALGSVMSYAGLLADESNYGSYSIRQYSLHGYMRLDSAAIRALNVMESKTDANKNFSLFGLMNRTCTAGMGKRLLHMWLKQPLLDVTEINSRLDLVQAFVEDTVLRQDLRQHLKRISDIERLVRYVEKRRASLQHIVKLYQSSIRLLYIRSALERYDWQFSSLMKQRYLDPLEDLTDDNHLNKFNKLVEASVDLDQLENGEYMISSGYDPKLCELEDGQESLEQKIHNLNRQTANELDLAVDKALKLDKGTQFGHVFRITKKEEPKIRKKLNTHFTVLKTRKDGVKFTNTKLKKLGDQYQKILEEYKNCQKELVTRVVQTAATCSEIFKSTAVLLSELDVLLSFADLAASCPTPYTRPDITPLDAGDIVLEGSRHPCVEAQDWVGVSILMVQVGSLVPCDKACISVRDCIFAHVGAGDCQLRGVSTFMQEMLEIASILKGATDKSLVIIYELGRGTSTYDGFGLAWAICEHLVEVIKAPTLFATHFHELTALAHENANDDPSSKKIVSVANYHVSAHIDSSIRKLTMLYMVVHEESLIKEASTMPSVNLTFQVEPGACDQSFGIHVAEFANFPESVITLARDNAAELKDFSPVTVISNDANEESDPEDTSRGAAPAHQFLKDFSELPLEKMDFKEALEQVRKLKNDLEKDAVNSLASAIPLVFLNCKLSLPLIWMVVKLVAVNEIRCDSSP